MPKALPVIDATAPVCCAPVAAAPMGEDAALEVAVRLKALADPVRLRLLSLLLAQDEVCTCDLAPAVGLTEATVSHHLGQLKKAGFVSGRASRDERLLPRPPGRARRAGAGHRPRLLLTRPGRVHRLFA